MTNTYIIWRSFEGRPTFSVAVGVYEGDWSQVSQICDRLNRADPEVVDGPEGLGGRPKHGYTFTLADRISLDTCEEHVVYRM
jgi:hypothetical protein